MTHDQFIDSLTGKGFTRVRGGNHVLLYKEKGGDRLEYRCYPDEFYSTWIESYNTDDENSFTTNGTYDEVTEVDISLVD